MWVNTLNPILFELGPLQIRWYGVVYVLGFFIAFWWLQKQQKSGKLDLTKDEIWDFLFYLMVGVLIGSRLFMIFWEPAYYLGNPLNLFKIWEGGMSFHGGFIGIITAAGLYCRKKKLHFWTIADLMSIPTLFALALGRIANFINGELVGRIGSGSWCVVFPQYDQACRHPSTLYDALKRFLIVGWLFFLNKREGFKPGFLFWNFVFWEGLGRFIVDFYRQDILYYGLSLGQWFSSVMIVVSIWFFFRKHKQDWIKMIMPHAS